MRGSANPLAGQRLGRSPARRNRPAHRAIGAVGAATLALGAIAATPRPAAAHGAAIDYRVAPSVEIRATYDSGEPMQEAQVNVYAPDNPAEPWTTGTTDADGRFSFVPDAAQSGNWEVMVRQAGHGGITTIPLEGGAMAAEAGSDGGESGTPASGTGESGTAGTSAPAAVTVASEARSGSPALSPLQRIFVAACVIWGFVGTGLFFWHRPNSRGTAAAARSPEAQADAPEPQTEG